MRRHAQLLAIASLIAMMASPASAQYFGRNKVRYRTFDFQVMRTEHFDIYFYPSEREGVDIAARLAERWYGRLEHALGHALSARQPLVLYASHADFEQTNVVTEELTEGTGGFTEPERRRIVLPLAGPISDTDHVIGHELVHAFQFDVAGPPGAELGQTAFARLPLWFVEGMAEYLSLGKVDANAAMKLREAAGRHQLPSISDLDDPKYFPYQWGHAVFAYIAGRYGEASIGRLLREGAASGNVAAAFTNALGVSVQELSAAWHAAVHEAYDPILSGSVPLAGSGGLALKGPRFGRTLNIAPSLSPDGRWIALLSARSLFSIDLYIADAATGRTVRRLTRTATDPHYSSIQFINSAGTWDAASEHFAIGTTVAGRAALAIFNVRTGKRERDVVMTGIDEILNPSWAPDGHAIVFTGMRQGLTDLYVYDVSTAALSQLTNDAYADLHPAWSPDSQRIAFATDRFSSDLSRLRIGALRLAIIDTRSSALEAAPAFDKGKHINPQWSSDGRTLYFIADPDGVPNVYRLPLNGGPITRMTALGVGVSGITAISPALSVSAHERFAVTSYADERYNIYLWNGAHAVTPPHTFPANADALPPVNSGAVVASNHDDPQPPSGEEYPTTPYKPKLSLTNERQLAAGIGINSFGPVLGEASGLTFTDMLGDRLLATTVRIGSASTGTFGLNDVAFGTGYLRLDHRWTWGIVGGQIPHLTGTYQSAPGATLGSEGLQVDRQTVYRETQRNAAAVVTYPFDRSRRIELTAGVGQTSFEQIEYATVYSAAGEVLSNTIETHQLGQRLNLTTSSVAFVFDTTSFGVAGPIQGQRYRLEVAPTFGSITYAGVLMDYRRYMMPVSFYTIAARVIHYGRYGLGGDDFRLHPVYINDPGLVRGYDALEDFATPCVALGAMNCRSNDPLVGSRALVGNLELRFPLLRPFGASRDVYGPLPIEVAFFGDSGVAWSRGQKPSVFGGSRPGISSAGVALRFGLGFAVGEFDMVRPFQRADGRWQFGVNLIPAW